MDLETRRFLHSDAVAASRVDAVTIQNWVKRGLLDPLIKVSRRWQRRMYSPRDICKLALMGRLAEYGVSVSKGAELCEAVFSELAGDPEPNWVIVHRKYGTSVYCIPNFAFLDSRPEFSQEADEAYLAMNVGAIRRLVLRMLKEIETARS